MTSLECLFRVLYHLKGFKEEVNKELSNLENPFSQSAQLLLSINDIIVQIEDNKNEIDPLDLNGVRNILFPDDYFGDNEKQMSFSMIFSYFFEQIEQEKLHFFEYQNQKQVKKHIITGIKNDKETKNTISNMDSQQYFKDFIAIQYDESFVPSLNKFTTFKNEYELIACINTSDALSTSYIIKKQSGWTFFDEGFTMDFKNMDDITSQKIPITFQIYRKTKRQSYGTPNTNSYSYSPVSISKTTTPNIHQSSNVQVMQKKSTHALLNIYIFYQKPDMKVQGIKIPDLSSLKYDLDNEYKLKKDHKRLFFFNGKIHQTLNNYNTEYDLDVYDFMASQEENVKKYLNHLKQDSPQNSISTPIQSHTYTSTQESPKAKDQIVYFFSASLSIRKMKKMSEIKGIRNKSDLISYAKSKYSIVNADVLCVKDLEIHRLSQLDSKYKVIVVQEQPEKDERKQIFNCVFITKRAPKPETNGICFRFLGYSTDFGHQLSKAFGTRSKFTIYQYQNGKDSYIVSTVNYKYTIHIKASDTWKLTLN